MICVNSQNIMSQLYINFVLSEISLHNCTQASDIGCDYDMAKDGW